MKEELIAYVNSRISWCKLEQKKLKQGYRSDEAAHMQIAINVYNIFLSTYQAMKYDLAETMRRFSAIVGTWDANHRKAHEHQDEEKLLIESIKIERALEIIQYAKELEE